MIKEFSAFINLSRNFNIFLSRKMRCVGVWRTFIILFLYLFFSFFLLFLKYFLSVLRIFKKKFKKISDVRVKIFSKIIITFLFLVSFEVALCLYNLFRRGANLALIRSRVLRISRFLPASRMRNAV